MNADDFFKKLSDDELAEWHMLTNKVESLKREIATCEQARQEELNRHRIAADVAARMHDDYRADLDKLLSRANVAEHNATRHRNQLAVIAQHMPTFLTDWLMTYAPFEDLALTPDAREMRRNAQELLTLLEPFAE